MRVCVCLLVNDGVLLLDDVVGGPLDCIQSVGVGHHAAGGRARGHAVCRIAATLYTSSQCLKINTGALVQGHSMLAWDWYII